MTLSRKTKAFVLATATLTTSASSQARPNTPVIMIDDAFQAYVNPNHTPTGCDVGSTIIMETGSLRGPIASLTDSVSGYCDLYVAPNPRSYTLTGEEIGCGSILWTGYSRTNEGSTGIEITDHRTRICDDLVANVLIIKETNAREKKTLYGYFPASQPM